MLNYKSAYDSGRDVSEAVPYWLEHGHMDDTGIENQFHDYEARYWLERTKQFIIHKYGNEFEIEIIDNKPNIV